MGQDPLFDPPTDRLARALHEQVFGALPTALARALDVPEVAHAVRPLLTGGWRPAQLAARVGALPEPEHPVPAVKAFLTELVQRASPEQAWQRERSERARPSGHCDEHLPASDEVREHYVAQARRALGARPPTARPSADVRLGPVCASCGQQAGFFVTRQVRLCAGCVELLGTGRARLSVGATG